MKVESLDNLKKAFEVWRRKKRHVREAVPDELLERADRAIGVYGWEPVAKATKIKKKRLERGVRQSKRRKVSTAAVPSFSRMELAPPAATGRPFAELETPTGLKIRIFTQTEEVLSLLASVCGTGGGR